MRPVLIATDPITPGDPLSVDVSESACRRRVPTVHRRNVRRGVGGARQHIGVGEIVTDTDVVARPRHMALVPERLARGAGDRIAGRRVRRSATGCGR